METYTAAETSTSSKLLVEIISKPSYQKKKRKEDKTRKRIHDFLRQKSKCALIPVKISSSYFEIYIC